MDKKLSEEIRQSIEYNNVQLLIEYRCDSISDFARKVGRSPSQAQAYVGLNPTKRIGNKTRRVIEEAFNLPSNWMTEQDQSHYFGKEPTHTFTPDGQGTERSLTEALWGHERAQAGESCVRMINNSYKVIKKDFLDPVSDSYREYVEDGRPPHSTYALFEELIALKDLTRLLPRQLTNDTNRMLSSIKEEIAKAQVGEMISIADADSPIYGATIDINTSPKTFAGRRPDFNLNLLSGVRVTVDVYTEATMLRALRSYARNGEVSVVAISVAYIEDNAAVPAFIYMRDTDIAAYRIDIHQIGRTDYDERGALVKALEDKHPELFSLDYATTPEVPEME